MAVNISRAGDGVVTFDFGVGIDPLVISDSNNIIVSSEETKNSVGTIIRQDLSFKRSDPYFFYQITYSQIGTINGSPKPAIGDDTTTLLETDVFQGTISGTITSNDITDATTVGKAVLTATDAATARTAIGAGISNLVIGTTGTTAMAGNAKPATAGAADTAIALATGRTFSITGGAAGVSAAFNGTANATINVTLATPTGSVKGGVLLQPAIADIAIAPTAADFNAVLSALRLAGVLTP